MTTLHLGVIDIPYSGAAVEVQGSKRRRKIKAGDQTTGDVAEILEAKYRVMEVFYEAHQDEIAKSMEDGLSAALESLMMGSPIGLDPFGSAVAATEQAFKKFLDNKEMDALGVPGVPTEAALKGVNHRLKHPYAMSNPERPSFIDTGLYENSFKVWID